MLKQPMQKKHNLEHMQVDFLRTHWTIDFGLLKKGDTALKKWDSPFF